MHWVAPDPRPPNAVMMEDIVGARPKKQKKLDFYRNESVRGTAIFLS